MKYYSTHDGSEFDRPEDAANYDYYNFGMETRRYRVTYDVTVEWRESQPSFSEQKLAVLLNTADVKDPVLIEVRPATVVAQDEHEFQPGIAEDDPTPNHHWCHVCGERRNRCSSVRRARATHAENCGCGGYFYADLAVGG